jgi:ADP-heptose:LPS heptosyltransferase
MAQLNKGYLYQNKTAVTLVKIMDKLLSMLPRKRRVLPFNITKILIIKPDHLGDMLMFSSVLPVIRSAFPSAQLDVAGNKWNRAILENNPYVSTFYPVNHYKMNREKSPVFFKIIEYFKTYFRALHQIKKEKYDLCLIMRAYGVNLIHLAKLGKCRYIIGHKTGGFGPLLDRIVAWVPGKHETGHYLEVLEPFGIQAKPEKLAYELYPSVEAKAGIKALCLEYGLNKNKTAVVHPGAGDLRRSLPESEWKKVIAILEKKNYRVVITGTSGERPLAEAIASERTKIICGGLSIHELALVFRESRVVITVDTLAAHLGGWSGTRTIVFYCGINDMCQWRALGKNVLIVSKECPDTPCYQGCSEMNCMKIDPVFLEKEV